MTTIKSAPPNLSLLQQAIEEELVKLDIPTSPASLYEPFSYMLKLGGKRLRPLMVLLACEAFGSDAKKAMPQAIAIELFHNFTLIHDDLMDHAKLRRGVSTVHEKFGNTAAILSGDVMLVYAYDSLLKCDRSLTSILHQKFNACAIAVCEGQQLDMDFEKREFISGEEYIQMITCKTASLIATALEIGALVGGASEKEAAHFFDFGKNLGIAFQMQDDWLDSFGEAEKFGKQKGGDILQRKKTSVLITALESGSAADKRSLLELYSKDSISEEEMNQVLSLFEATGAKQKTQEKMTEYYHQALYQVSLSKSSEKGSLESVAASLFHRDY